MAASLVEAESGHLESKDVALEYATYEDYLDSQVGTTDMFYLEVRRGRAARSYCGAWV